MKKIFAISLLVVTSSQAFAFGDTRWMPVSDYCQISSIIHPSRKDTPETLRQIAAANTKYRTLCSPGEKNGK